MKLLVVALLAFVLSTTGQSGTGASSADTCHGRVATITGSPGGFVGGTEGSDVIVTNGASGVTGHSGADIICVTGTATSVRVWADSGDDLVDTTSADARRIDTSLGGPGADTFLGGAVRDRVFDGSFPDSEVDNIATGGGNDVLSSGRSGQVNYDVLKGGPGEDTFHMRGIFQAPGVLLPGGSNNRLGYLLDGDTAIDLRARTVTVDGQTRLTWQGHINQVVTNPPAGASASTLTFSGSGAADVLRVDGRTVVVAHLRGGDDRLEAPEAVATDSTLSAGPGHDTLAVHFQERGRRQPAYIADIAVDLAAHTLFADTGVDLAAHTQRTAGQVVTTAVIHGFDTVLAGANSSLVVRGDQHANTVLSVGCSVRVDGRGGVDILRTRQPTGTRCPGASTRYLSGGPGHDRVIGGRLADVLIGGPGRDTADGRDGFDRCRAEVTRNCEH